MGKKLDKAKQIVETAGKVAKVIVVISETIGSATGKSVTTGKK